MKKVVAIIVVVIIALGVGAYLYNVNISKKQLEDELNQAKESWEQKVIELEDNELDDIHFDSSKIKSESTMVVYEEYNADLGSSGLNIEIVEGKPYLSTDVTNDQYGFLFSEVTEPIENMEITGFNQPVRNVYFAFMGNGDMAPYILFLMEDGTVEYINSSKMLNGKNYKSAGKVEELSNIVKFVHLNAQDIDENGEGLSGWMTCAAIDEEGYSFDLSQSKTIQEDMLSSAF